MHVNTVFYQTLKGEGAGPAWVGLEWKTRQRTLTTLYTLAAKAVIEADGLAEKAGEEIAGLTGSPLLGEVARKALTRWAAARFG